MDKKEAIIQKVAEIIQGQCGENGYCALTLMDTDNRPNTTTISPSKADGIKTITFCTGFGTRTERIQFRPDACVCFNSPEYHISLKGTMEIITDPDVKREMWYSGLANYFVLLFLHYLIIKMLPVPAFVSFQNSGFEETL